MTDATGFLQRWFLSHCNGDWEHDKRVEISSLDNPGWYVSINLRETDLEGVTLDYTVLRDSEPTWLHCWADGRTFEAAAGPLGLANALEHFRIFASDETMPSRHRGEVAPESADSLLPAIHFDR